MRGLAPARTDSHALQQEIQTVPQKEEVTATQEPGVRVTRMALLVQGMLEETVRGRARVKQEMEEEEVVVTMEVVEEVWVAGKSCSRFLTFVTTARMLGGNAVGAGVLLAASALAFGLLLIAVVPRSGQ